MKIGGVTITSGAPGSFDRTNWTERQIRGSEKGAVVGLWVGMIAPLLFGLFAAWHMRMGFFMAKNVPNPFLCVLTLASLISGIRAVWETIRLKRFGDPMLELNTAPIPLGGTVESRVTFNSSLSKAPEFTVILACIRRTNGSGKNSSYEKTLWSGTAKATLMLGGILPISIAVPTDQPPSNGTDPFDRILWRLTVKAPFHGPAFLEKYEIPVGSPPSS